MFTDKNPTVMTNGVVRLSGVHRANKLVNSVDVHRQKPNRHDKWRIKAFWCPGRVIAMTTANTNQENTVLKSHLPPFPFDQII
jgi:hypothetical protein